MRITEFMMTNTVIASESTAQQQMARLSSEAASGLAVQQPSDDPAAFSSLVQQDAQIGVVTARQSAATVAGDNLNLAQTTLNEASTLVQQAESIASEAANGSQTAASRADSATQVNGLFQQLLALANTQGSNGYLFGGTKTATPPFDANGNFSGNSDTTQVEIANGVLAVSNASGADAFTAAGGRNVFADVQSLATALSTNDTAGIQSSIANLGASFNQIVSAQVDTSEQASVLQSAGTAMTNALTQMQVTRANVGDADAATTFSSLQASETSYQEAIQVNQSVLSAAYANPN
ncbi:MAG: hypothetical protein ABSC94_17165 [Polyangiaceae bacterium]|jgi:flagellar hook-associated protein 3 FlgL